MKIINLTEKYLEYHHGYSMYHSDFSSIPYDMVMSVDVEKFKMIVLNVHWGDLPKKCDYIAMMYMDKGLEVTLVVPFMIFYPSMDNNTAKYFNITKESTTDDSLELNENGFTFEFNERTNINEFLHRTYTFYHTNFLFINKYIFGIYWKEFLKLNDVDVIDNRSQK